jgi:cell volume regulation protein A
MDSTLDLLGISTLIGGALVVLSIVLGFLTSRVGLPVLLIFLAMGMLAGEDGLGKIVFNNYQLSFWIANIALAMILLDGGLRTPLSIFRVALKPAILLSTVGVLLTCLLMGFFAVVFFDLPIGIALLFGAIVSSTDAAAVFALLKNSGIRLNERVEATLEIESGINDPMAIFLTILAISFLLEGPKTSELVQSLDVLWMLAKQLGLGILIAYLCGYTFVRLLRRLKVEAFHNHGLNALLVAAAGISVFGLSTYLGGSGFLSIYIFGLVLGNQKMRFVKTIVPAMDGLAWLFQSSMFLLLGLLATPSQILASLGSGLGLAMILMFIVRPLAVIPCLYFFRYSFKEMFFISWVGLRGAVPIVLAIFPIIAGVDNQRLMLDFALLVVITSLLLQGSTISVLARRLGLVLPDATDRNAQRKTFGSFGLDGAAQMTEIAFFYGLTVDPNSKKTLDEWLKAQLAKPPVVGDIVQTPLVAFVVKEMKGNTIIRVGVLQAT